MEEEKGPFESLPNGNDESTEEVVGNKSSDLSSKDLERKINAIEQSLGQRTSLDILFSQKFSDLRIQLEREVDSRFRNSRIYGTLALVILGVFGVFGYQHIRDSVSDSVTREVNKRFTEPEINAAVARAMEKKSEAFVATK